MRYIIVTHPRFTQALRHVRQELRALGFWDNQLAAVRVRLVPFESAYGWQWLHGSGDICIPKVSLCRIRDWFSGTRCSLRDVLRHEFAHALADTHRGLIRSQRFTCAFGASHDSEQATEYDSQRFVTEYAATEPAEDLAETFMLYVRHNGRLPSRFNTPAIRRKWCYIHHLRAAIRRGQTRFRPLRPACAGRVTPNITEITP